MTPHDREARLLDYLNGDLPENERLELEHQLAHDDELRRTLDDMKDLLQGLDALPARPPSAQLHERLEALIRREKQNLRPAPRSRPQSEWLAAAAAVLVLIGVGLGYLWQCNRRQQVEILALQAEIKNTRRFVMLAALEKPSASERIQAVSLLKKESADPKTISALIYAMNFDEVLNVRLKAAQALGQFGYDPVVKDALLGSLRTQNSPELQIAIIDILVDLNEKRALPAFQEMLVDQSLLRSVRNKAAWGIGELS